MDKLIIRAYNVGFGDAYLIKIPDKSSDGKTHHKHILIDFGNAMSKEGGRDDVFEPVIKDIIKELDGKPLDLYVMTHEHMDHVQGLLYSNKNIINNLKTKLKTKFSWLTASSAPDYYDKHTDAKKTFDKHNEAYLSIDRYAKSIGLNQFSKLFQIIFHNNNPRRTSDCVSFLRELAPKRNTFFIHRGFKLRKNKHHDFNETKFEIWAPEEDTSIYYGRLQMMALGFESKDKISDSNIKENLPPKGVDASSFYEMIEKRKHFSENLLAIDKAKNNTSVVICIKWRGWRLLFAGDAEEKSWKVMNKEGVIKSVDFLKVSHHGSHNGTPSDEIFNKVFPVNNPTNKKRSAVVSTFENQYNKVPDIDTLNFIKNRCDEFSVLYEEVDAGSFKDFEFEG